MSAYQLGGYLLISRDQARPRIIKIDKDPIALGRWVWSRYRGRNNTTVRAISVYMYRSNLGPTTVFSHQRSYYDKLGIEEHPRTIIINDLCSYIKEWQEMGDLIILMIDANEDITNRDLARALSELNIIEAITNKYSSS